MKLITAAIATTIILTGCSHQAPAPQKAPESGGNFMPLYLDTISHKYPYKATCEAHTLEELLLPCETNQ